MEKESEINCSREMIYPVICDYIPEVFRLKAKKDLNETAKNVEQGLEALKKCIERENLNLINDDNFLLMYLRQTKFDIKKAETKLRNSLKGYSHLEDLVESCSMERIRAVVEAKFAGILPYRDGEGRTVVFTQGHAWKKDLFNMTDVTAAMSLLCLFASMYPMTSINGFSYIADARVESLYDLLPMFNAFRLHLPYLMLCPIRVQRVDAINVNYLCRCLYSTIRPIVPTKLKNRVFLHGENFEKLQEAYPPSMLPSEFGGEMGPISCNSYKENFFEFLQNLKFYYRPNKS